jgi:acetolactate synthase-1/2/3 large subunit
VNTILDEKTVLMREAPQLALPFLDLEHKFSFFNMGAAGGLGWGVGAAVGAKLADPEKTIIAVEGDGSYMFNVPIASHYVALEQNLPFITVIMNNRRWHEVQAATAHLYPKGQAVTGNARASLTHFHPKLQLAKIVEAVGGYGEQISDPQALIPALQNALRVVRDEKRQVVLDVICA